MRSLLQHSQECFILTSLACYSFPKKWVGGGCRWIPLGPESKFRNLRIGEKKLSWIDTRSRECGQVLAGWDLGRQLSIDWLDMSNIYRDARLYLYYTRHWLMSGNIFFLFSAPLLSKWLAANNPRDFLLSLSSQRLNAQLLLLLFFVRLFSIAYINAGAISLYTNTHGDVWKARPI